MHYNVKKARTEYTVPTMHQQSLIVPSELTFGQTQKRGKMGLRDQPQACEYCPIAPSLNSAACKYWLCT